MNSAKRRFRRSVFTGELEEVWEEDTNPFKEINEKMRNKVAHLVGPKSHFSSPWCREMVSQAMSLKPEDATPDRIAQENEEAKRHGTGAYYTPDGLCHLPTRGSRAKECRRTGRMDLDAGYSDWAV